MRFNIGAFGARINSSIALLRKCDLFLKGEYIPRTSINGIASLLRKKNYAETWRLLLEESCFRILLNDFSFFTFDIDPTGIKSDNLVSMSYYGSPYVFVPLESFIIEQYGEEYLIFKDDPQLIEEYEQTLSDSSLIDMPVTFRYKYSPRQYDPGRHPASHLHIGHKNEIRVGCERILNPLSFIAFVIRQQYPQIWSSIVLCSHIRICKASIRDSIPVVPEEYISLQDKLEMFFS